MTDAAGSDRASVDAGVVSRREPSEILKALRRAVRELKGLMDELAGLASRLLKEVSKQTKAVTEAELQATLRSMSVRSLGTGLRYGALEKGGIRTVADAMASSHQRILAIRGVGELTADALGPAIRAAAESARAGVRVLPPSTPRRSSDTTFLRSVAELSEYRRRVAPDLPAAKQRSGELTARASGAMKGHGKVRRLFSSRARQEAAASAAPVLAELAEFLEHARALLSAVKATSLTDDVLWQHYRQNNSDFVATLESSGVRAAVAASPGAGVVAPGQQRGGSWPGQQSVRVPAGPPPPPDPFGNLPPELAKAIEAFDLKPGPLTASLRRYQEFGARFLAVQGRSVLGDDMGLGKTVEVLACMCHLHALGKRHFFVVAPNSVCINWVREVNKHTRLAAFLVHGQGRETTLRQWQSEGGVAITTYGTLAAVAPQIGSVDLLVADEAHLIKNPSATRTTVFRNLAGKAQGVALLTGTALENRLEEMGSIVSLVRPNLSYLVDQLVNVFQPDPLETRHRLAEVYLRRTQRDVLTELPEMTQVEEWVTLEGDHLRTYQAALLSSLMAGRQAAVVGADRVDSPKLERLGELLENYRSEGRKVVVFSFFRRVLDLVSQVAGGCAQINGSVPAAQRQRIIDDFSNTQGFAVLASQIDAGGLGVNLQAANVVVLMEPQWKPSTERQAVARVHRMGQVDKVMVHRLLARDTVEEWMIQLLAAKQLTFDTYADPSSLKDSSAMAADGAMPAIDAELRAMIEQQRAQVSLPPPNRGVA